MATWRLLLDSAVFLLLGLILASFVSLLLHEGNFQRFLGRRRGTGVFRAALFGIPLPLCSCAVLPVAYQLRRAGVSKGATVAFLISTPESGVDSIFLTYSLTDPLMTVARPTAAFLAASVAGLGEVMVPSGHEHVLTTATDGPTAAAPEKAANASPERWLRHQWRRWRYAFADLVGDLGRYLLLGYLLGGLAVLLLGGETITIPTMLRSGWGSYLGALIVGLPLYTCATSSTPFAAALLTAGFSPGAVLVFLLVGPATNVASLVTVKKILGLSGTIRYLISIAVSAVVAGLAVDALYGWWGLSDWYLIRAPEETASWFTAGCAALIALLMIGYTGRYYYVRLRAVFS
jgi:uncharacterized membrane protein YraQ (UPF0718 family)